MQMQPSMALLVDAEHAIPSPAILWNVMDHNVKVIRFAFRMVDHGLSNRFDEAALLFDGTSFPHLYYDEWHDELQFSGW
jgi:hypothetical protein